MIHQRAETLPAISATPVVSTHPIRQSMMQNRHHRPRRRLLLRQLQQRLHFTSDPVLTPYVNRRCGLNAGRDDDAHAAGQISLAAARQRSGNELDSASAQVRCREVVIVDPSAADYKTLVVDLVAHAGSRELLLLMLDSGQDALAQIESFLAKQKEVDALHLISHGDDAKLRLGDHTLTVENLSAHVGAISSWANSLADGADLLLYGCDTAACEDGRMLADALAALSGANVAAIRRGSQRRVALSEYATPSSEAIIAMSTAAPTALPHRVGDADLAVTVSMTEPPSPAMTESSGDGAIAPFLDLAMPSCAVDETFIVEIAYDQLPQRFVRAGDIHRNESFDGGGGSVSDLTTSLRDANGIASDRGREQVVAGAVVTFDAAVPFDLPFAGDAASTFDAVIDPTAKRFVANDQAVIEAIGHVIDIPDHLNWSSTPRHLEHAAWIGASNPIRGVTFESRVLVEAGKCLTPELSLPMSIDKSIVDTAQMVTVTAAADMNEHAGSQFQFENIPSAPLFERAQASVGIQTIDTPAELTVMDVVATERPVDGCGQLDADEAAMQVVPFDSDAVPMLENLGSSALASTLPDVPAGDEDVRTAVVANTVDVAEFSAIDLLSICENRLDGDVCVSLADGDLWDHGIVCLPTDASGFNVFENVSEGSFSVILDTVDSLHDRASVDDATGDTNTSADSRISAQRAADGDGPPDGNRIEAHPGLRVAAASLLDIEIVAPADHAFSPSDDVTWTVTVGDVGSQCGESIEVVTAFPPAMVDPLSIVSSDPTVSVDPARGQINWDTGRIIGGGLQPDCVMGTLTPITTDGPAGGMGLSSLPTADDTNHPNIALPNDQQANGRAVLQKAFAPWFGHRDVSLRQAQPLRVDPIYSGLVQVCTTLLRSIFEDAGHEIFARTAAADVTGNWLTSVPSALVCEHPQAVTVETIIAIHALAEDRQHNKQRSTRPPAIPGIFFSPRPTIHSVVEEAPGKVIAVIHGAHLQPTQFASDHSSERNPRYDNANLSQLPYSRSD